MSWIRIGTRGSDVYVYEHVDGFYECCGCPFGDHHREDTEAGMEEHLRKHREAGHCVPEGLLPEDRTHKWYYPDDPMEGWGRFINDEPPEDWQP